MAWYDLLYHTTEFGSTNITHIPSLAKVQHMYPSPNDNNITTTPVPFISLNPWSHNSPPSPRPVKAQGTPTPHHILCQSSGSPHVSTHTPSISKSQCYPKPPSPSPTWPEMTATSSIIMFHAGTQHLPPSLPAHVVALVTPYINPKT